MILSDLGLATPPWIVGHRGAAGIAPENTLDSLQLAVEQGADMIELDLQLTADGQLVACHDWDLRRMGDSELVIEQSALAELQQIEISGAFRDTGCRRTLATLGEVLALLPAQLPINLELKRRQAAPAAIAEQLVAAIADRQRVLISSFDWPLLTTVRQRLPEVAIAPLGGRSTDPNALIAAARELAAVAVHCRQSLASRELIAAARRPVLVYTINDAPAAQQAFANGVSGIFTDFPGRLRQQLMEVTA